MQAVKAIDYTIHYYQHAPDPGNAGVGRGNKLSVLHIQPWCADGLTFFI
jgi:hypothetical protein